MNLANIIKSITGDKAVKRTAADLRADLASIDIDALERKVAEIERHRRDLLLSGTDAELLAITQDLSAANLEAERAQAAVDELKRLIAAAETREALAAVEQRATEGRAARERLVSAYAAADRLAADLGEVLAQIVRDRDALRATNKLTFDAGRRDLKISDPIGELAALVGVVGADSLPNPTGWTLSGYWPRHDAAGNRVGIGRPLARIIELQSAPL